MVDDIRPARKPQNENPSSGINKIENPNLDEPVFVPPEVIASREEERLESVFEDDSGSIGIGADPHKKASKKRSLWKRYKTFVLNAWPDSKKGRIIASLVIFLIFAGGSGGAFALINKKPAPVAKAPAVQTKPAEPAPKPTTEPSRLTGVNIPIELNKRQVTSVQIENSPDARPQSGLKDAGVVFEAIAEGGITRFNAIFMEAQPDYIGPVRSIRPYYIDFLLPFDASVVHAGGSAEGLAKIQQLGIRDIDHGANGGAFQRVSDRYAPHNLYTSMAALDAVSQARGYTASNFTGFLRKVEKPPTQPLTAKGIDFNISSFLYNPHYDYNPGTNGYARSLGGKFHTDQRSGATLEPKVVIALVMGYSQNGIYSVYQTNGSGEMFVFQDGQVQKGTWKKASPKDQFEFLDAAGQKLAINPGQTWISIVADSGRVTYTP